MTALTVEADRAVTGGVLRRLPSEISANPFVGSLLSYASDGYVHELVAGEAFAGIASGTIQTKDAASADGSRYIDATAGEFDAVLALSSVTVADIGRRVYATDDNAFAFTQASASTYVGRVIGVESSTKAIVRCQTFEVPGSVSYSIAAAGTALTNSTTRTALAAYTIKAGTLRAGSRIRVRAQIIATATNGTDTLLMDVGGAVGGTPAALLSGTATDVANDAIGVIDAEFIVRTIGATGTIVGFGHVSTLAAAGTSAPLERIAASTTIDTTADIVLGVYGTWSVANAGNSCRADVFSVEIVR